MTGALDVLAFAESGVGAVSAGWVQPAAQQCDGMAPAVVSDPRGKNRAPLGSSGERCGGGKIARRDRSVSDAEGGDETDPVGVDVRFVGGFPHEGPNGDVAAKVSPDLLEHEVG